jgi:hypothetical protein
MLVQNDTSWTLRLGPDPSLRNIILLYVTICGASVDRTQSALDLNELAWVSGIALRTLQY